MAAMISWQRSLLEVPNGSFWGDLKCAVVESAADVSIMDVLTQGIAALQTCGMVCLAGVAFGPKAELKWVRRREGVHAVFISDRGDALPGDAKTREITPVKEESVFLWGRFSGNTLFEDRIPREFAVGPGTESDDLLRYPALPRVPKDQHRLALILRWYEVPICRPTMTQSGVVWGEATAQVSRWVEFTDRELE